jgi:hypothetical protein
MPDLRSLPLDRFANFVYWSATRNSSPADIEKFRAKLWRPPRGVAVIDKRSPWAPENEQKGFAGLKASLGLGGPKPAA